ncbi:MAG: hypothetical protein ACUVSL_12345 [Chloroflexus sp.]|uniref:hypothetical protein n=1 Tax=Chloroflexus sp. TaxID=1904827 RepID=UPI00404A536D
MGTGCSPHRSCKYAHGVTRNVVLFIPAVSLHGLLTALVATWVILLTTDRLRDRDEHTPHPHDQQGQRHNTRLIVSTADAAAWLPHSKLRDTRMTSGKGN